MKNFRHPKTNLLVVLGWLFLFLSCSQGEKKSDQLKIIEGTWVMRVGDTDIYEKWIQVNDTLFRGISYELTGKDSAFTEQIEIRISGDRMFYIPTVTEQNGGLPVSFELTDQTDGKFVFDNPEHDFPTRITYEFVSADSMNASVSGMIRDELRTLDFNYHRIK
jgi:hypothetical protein